MATVNDTLKAKLRMKWLEDEPPRQNNSKPSDVSICMVPHTICMVPHTLRHLHRTAYTPKIFSIGPLHKKDRRLRAMDAQKVTYMHQLFRRIVPHFLQDKDIEGMTQESVEEIMSQECVEAMQKREELTNARACYAPSFKNYGNYEFAKMMVIDGCFILELLYEALSENPERGSIFFNKLLLQEVKSDLLLLENQIPFPILKVLFNLTLKKIDPCLSLIDLIFKFFKDMDFLHNVELHPTDEKVEPCHILGLLQSCYRPRGTDLGDIPTISISATEIAGAGVIFKEKKDKTLPLEVKFQKSPLFPMFFSVWEGTLFGWLGTPDLVRDTSFKIPVLCIKYFTVSFLRNLIAYEQCCLPQTEHYVTSFAFLMDKLIETKDDVSLLVRSKVLQHHLGSCEEVTTIFNNICNGVVLGHFHYSSQVKDFETYRKRCWPTLLIFLRNLYRTTTWKTLTVIVAMVIFILTLIQTICSV